MDRVQRNGGTAGIIAGLLLLLVLIMILSLGREVMAPGDPAKSLAAVTQKWGLFATVMIVGTLAAGVAVPFTVGIATRLRDGAPTRARALLYVTLLGLGGYAVASLMLLLGGRQVVEFAGKDPAAATTAWLTLRAVDAGLDTLGSAFTGAGSLIAGWAILSTRVMGSGVAWVGIAAGVLGILTVFAPTAEIVFLGSFVLTIIWLIWAGAELRGTKSA